MDPTTTTNRGTASLGGSVTTLSPGLRTLPIIVVPGIMGTRLINARTRRFVWNPPGTGCPGISNIDGKFLGRLENEALPADAEPPLAPLHPDRPLADQIEGFYELVTNSYVGMFRELHLRLPAALAPLGYKPKLYGVGYDWRRSNAKSAARLSQRVTEIMAECDGEKPFLIAHSMGGLVTRYFCRNFGGEAKVRAVFLFGSPTMGSPKAYGLVKSGIPLDVFNDRVMSALRLLLGQFTRKSSMAFCRRLESLWELMPHPFFLGQVLPRWLQFDHVHTGYPEHDPIGLLGPTARPTANPALQFSDTNNLLLYFDKYTGLREFFSALPLLNARLASMFAFHVATQGVEDPAHVYLPPETEIFASNLWPVVSRVNLPFRSAGFSNDETIPPTWVKVRTDPAEMVHGGGVFPDSFGDGTCPGYSARVPDHLVEEHVNLRRHKLQGDHEGILAEGAPLAAQLIVERLTFVGPEGGAR